MATFKKKTANARYTMSSKALKLNISAVQYNSRVKKVKEKKKKHTREKSLVPVRSPDFSILQLYSLDLLGGSMRMQARQAFITHVRHELAFSFLMLIVI